MPRAVAEFRRQPSQHHGFACNTQVFTTIGKRPLASDHWQVTIAMTIGINAVLASDHWQVEASDHWQVTKLVVDVFLWMLNPFSSWHP